ncbi:MAG: 1-deoxy-D-xylulose-5-phosphate reductoisomerase [Acidimicrobiaceae bacterium]|nr:1-deoxy-D-xylulose-5-phosphate reductoisomerase [Acidimicrobiaceae bacterium]
MKTVSLVGSTGSIGTQAIDVICAQPDEYQVIAIGAARSLDALVAQAELLRPRQVAIADPALAHALQERVPRGTEVLAGPEAMAEIARHADVVVNGVVGFAGLRVTLAALEAGHRLALANKESLIAGGPVVQRVRATRGAEIVPVDSEHCAIHQCLRAVGDAARRANASATRHSPDAPAGTAPAAHGGTDPAAHGGTDPAAHAGTDPGAHANRPVGGGATSPVDWPSVRRIMLTASGGPFRGRSAADLTEVTIEDALAHPTWQMGPKITVDSSTLMNKGLEVIEADELFHVGYDRIDVVVHPQSIIHSMVETTDGAVMAQLSLPDMRLPIGYALAYPGRLATPFGAIDWKTLTRLDFEQPDREAFPCLDLAYHAGRAGGSAPATLNGANEVAVAAFLKGQIRWIDISVVIERVLGGHDVRIPESVEDVLDVDREARRRATEAVERLGVAVP